MQSKLAFYGVMLAALAMVVTLWVLLRLAWMI
jgi:hypothetical protein